MSDTPGFSEAASKVGRSPTALVVENDRALRDLLRVHLHNAGYNVILAPDAVVAGRTILERPDAVDLLLINAVLPFMSGIDFVSTLIADTRLRFIPTIVIANGDDDARRADFLGVPALVAPFSAQQLLSLVRATLKSPVAVPKAPPRRPLRVVIADDEPDIVSTLMAIISHQGHSVFGSHHAPDVLPEVRVNKPDAVILDIDMPGVSGFAIAREIRELFGDAAPLLVAVSGKWFSQTDRMLAQLAGFDFFLKKPCPPDELLKLIEGEKPARTAESEFPCGPSLTFQT